MTHEEFLPYHNHHVRFKLSDGRELSGVLSDTLRHLDKNIPDTAYEFIPTINMIDWKQAEQKGDKEKMKSLAVMMNISNIIWVQHIKD